MSKYAVILAAAGKSSRFAKDDKSDLQLADARRQKKVFRELKGRPVWLRSAELFSERSDVAQLIIVLAADDIDWFKEKFKPNLAFLNLDIVAGGSERADSVQNALALVRSDIDFVAIHDAARPVLTNANIDRVFAAAEKHGAAIPGLPISSTVKRVRDNCIEETVPRQGLWQAQTPQVFARDILLEAYAKRNGENSTDDAQLVEQIGHHVHVVNGSPLNIKITNREDLRFAEAMLALLPKGGGLDSLVSAKEESPKSFFDQLNS